MILCFVMICLCFVRDMGIVVVFYCRGVWKRVDTSFKVVDCSMCCKWDLFATKRDFSRFVVDGLDT